MFKLTHYPTTAFTDKPVSMKYRGAFKLLNRKPGMINYGSEVRDASPQEIYRDWFARSERAKPEQKQRVQAG